jgi:hypothetical protein
MHDQTKARLHGHDAVFFITFSSLFRPSPGVMVYRHNRKLMMMVSDFAAGIATLAILVLQFFTFLNIGICMPLIIYGLGMAFQWPAVFGCSSV